MAKTPKPHSAAVRMVIDNAAEPPVAAGNGDERQGGLPPGGGAEPAAVPRSEDALAQSLSDDVLCDDYLYVAAEKKWFRWTGQVWQHEKTLLVEDLTRALCRREARAILDDEKLARAIDGETTIRRVERLARALRRHASRIDQFDADPWLLNTPAGVMDLRTGQLGPHDRALFLTKSTAVAPAAKVDCPRWLRVIREATGDDAALADYLQRLFGYGLVGVVTEHVVAVLHGSEGGEGKGVIINTIAGLMGDYAAVAPADMLTPQVGERHSTDLAGLRGARLVVASEIEKGRYWAEAKLKSISGGDMITARFMRGDFFTYRPQFTLVLATNHVPQLRSAGGMRRRLQIAPFLHRPEKPDPELPEKLRVEWPGILAWLIEGALLWVRNGLRPPAAVKTATDEYFASENPITEWLEERCIKHPEAAASTDELHRDFQSWAAGAGEPLLTKLRFRDRVKEAGFSAAKVHGGKARGFLGIGLKDTGNMFASSESGR